MTSIPRYQIGFSTLEQEVHLDQVPVTGHIPAWLQGTLVRNGPAKFEIGRRRYRHWFDGLAMLHKFSFRGQHVNYSNRFLRSRSFQEATASDKISRSEFATDPCRSLFGRVLSIFFPRFTDNACVNVTMLASRYVALTETPLPILFDPETLRTLGVFNDDGQLQGQISTAHPHFDFRGDSSFLYRIELARKSRYHVFCLPGRNRGHSRLVGSVSIDEPAYIHSFGMSERYVVLAECPLVTTPFKQLLRGRPYIENYEWKPERGTRFWVLSKDNGKLIGRFETEAVFAFHHVNAFEQGDDLVLDLVTYPNPSIIDALYLDNLRNKSEISTGQLRRYRLNLQTRAAAGEFLSNESLELPRINYQAHNTRPYRYVYGTGNRLPGNFHDQLIKINVHDGWSKTWSEAECYPGEPVFVAAPDRSKEDAGVILSVVLDAKKGASFLLILDAESFEERARAEVPHHIPFGLHGQYFGDLAQVITGDHPSVN
ncbi:MAG: carotenoid oxygenase family protein [Nitrospiraceae bacterium]